MTLVRKPPPNALKRVEFWLYVLNLGFTRADVHAGIDGFVSSGHLSQADAARLRIKVDDAEEYERLDPDLLLMAQLLGIAQSQAEIDNHYRAARQ